MTNLENLRKQARQLLRWHREHNYAVASRIRAALPRYHGLSDEQILAQRFVLADAQLLLAREAGFETWAMFKSGVAQMPHAAAGPHPDAPRQPVLTQPSHNCSYPTSPQPARSSNTSWASPWASPTVIRPTTVKYAAITSASISDTFVTRSSTAPCEKMTNCSPRRSLSRTSKLPTASTSRLMWSSSSRWSVNPGVPTSSSFETPTAT